MKNVKQTKNAKFGLKWPKLTPAALEIGEIAAERGRTVAVKICFPNAGNK
jgi:hypothetical protein